MFQLVKRKGGQIGCVAFTIALSWILLMPMGWSQDQEKEVSFQLIHGGKLRWEAAEILALHSDMVPERPQFVVNDKAVLFYTRDGRLGKSRRFPRPIHTIAAEKFLGVYYLAPETEGQKLNWEVFEPTGDRACRLLWTIESDQLVPRFFLSNRGATVAFFPEECLIKFFDSKGQEIFSGACFENAAFAYERNVAGVFSSDGQWLALATMKDAAVPDTPDRIGRSGSPVLILFDQSGQEQWRVALPGYWSSHVAISGHGDYLVVSSYRFDEINGVLEPTTMLFNQKSQEILAVDFLFRMAHFSPEDNFLLLADRNQVLLIDLQNHELLWRKSFAAIEGLLINAAMAVNAEAIALLFADGKYVKGKFLYENPQLLWLDHSGTELDVQRLSPEPFQNSVLKFSVTGEEVFVATGSEYFQVTKSLK